MRCICHVFSLCSFLQDGLIHASPPSKQRSLLAHQTVVYTSQRKLYSPNNSKHVRKYYTSIWMKCFAFLYGWWEPSSYMV